MTAVQTLTNGTLSEAQVAAYWRDGCLFPIEVADADQTARWRAALETLEARYADGGLPEPLTQYKRINAHSVMEVAARIALHRPILDVVEAILGPDLMAWSVEFFIKEPGDGKIVSMHQDLTYWGLGETDSQMTAWVALSPATVESGCMKVKPGSHTLSLQPHTDTFSDDNLLSRGQEVAVDVPEADLVAMEIMPGQMSLHHGQIIHGSGPNLSDDRRIAVAIRYVNPNARQKVAQRDYAMLARGCDAVGSFIHFAPPVEDFAPAATALHAQMLADQSVALKQGMDGQDIYFTRKD